MSLNLLLPDEAVTELLTRWPDEPRVCDRGKTELDETVTAAYLNDYVDTGCVPAGEIAVVKAPGPSLNQNAYMANGRTDPAKLRKLYEKGFTLRLGNLQRVIPFMAHVSRTIQRETGYSNYIHAFLTPPGSQGLRHHWDQQMAVIVQIAGVKRWHLWRPPVEAPMREYNESWRVWRDHYVQDWEAAGPDLEVDLRAGQSLLLPRGWVHNPHVVDAEDSIHLTFAIRERTPLWLSEQLVATVIHDPAFRRIIQPAYLHGNELVAELEAVRQQLLHHIAGLEMTKLADQVRRAAEADLEYAT